MNNFYTWIFFVIISVLLGFIKYKGNVRYNFEEDLKDGKRPPISWIFVEVWNHSFNFFIGCSIFYYFIDIRYKFIVSNGILNFGDFVLLFIIAMCFLGYFTHLLKNITQGINAILEKVISKTS